MLDADLVGIDLSQPGPAGVLTLHWLRSADGARQDEQIPVAVLDDKQRRNLLRALDKAMNGPGTAIARAPKRVDDCPVAEIVTLYHDILPMLPRVVKLTPSRIAAVRARWVDALPNLDEWREYFELVRKSAFLTGRSEGKHPFLASFDWLITPSNMVKTIEGNYA